MTSKDLEWMNLPDGFEFGIVETDEEEDELIKFNENIHRPEDAKFLKRILDNLPNFGRERNYYVRDLDKGIIVSSINSIPSTWDYDGVALRNLELGFVGTLESYRKKGFIRTLYSFFNKVLIDEEHDISSIQGIPYYYRQFPTYQSGYDFILPLDRVTSLRVDRIPAIKSESTPSYMDISIRSANDGDRKHLVNLYEELKGRLLISGRRSETLWKIQERLRMEFSNQFESMVLERNGKIDGYFRVLVRGDKENSPYGVIVQVIESSIRSFESVMRTLYFLREEAIKRGLYLLVVPGTRASNLCKVVLDFGGTMGTGWKHQIRIPNMVSFLNKIRPVIETRIIGTMFEGLSQEVVINAYRQSYNLNFVNGKIDRIEDIGIQDEGKGMEVRTPPHDLVRLVLGEYDISELNKHNIDFIVRGTHRALIETLFPKRESYIFPYYC
ncbi:MAG: hypothetical protein ACXADL_09675 [Candidatus Thorarchaeota archaeon]|jgi:hypothetical protein